MLACKTWILESDQLRFPADAAVLAAAGSLVEKSSFAHFTGSPSRHFFDYVLDLTVRALADQGLKEGSARLVLSKAVLADFAEELRSLNTALCVHRVVDECGMLALLELTVRLRQSESPVTVVVPSFNPRIPDLRRCLDSVLRACDATAVSQNCQVILVDDGSSNSDEVRAMLTEHYSSEKRLVYNRLAENQGVASARNWGLLNAAHDLVFFVDHDDEVEPLHINLGVQEALVSGADIAASNMRFPDGHIFCAHLSAHRGVLLENVFGSGIVVNKRSPRVRSLLASGQFYNVNNKSHFEDWELNCLAKLLRWQISVTPYASYFYHYAPTGRDSTNLSLKRRAWLMTAINAIDRVKALSRESAYCHLREYSESLVEQILTSEVAWNREREQLKEEAALALKALRDYVPPAVPIQAPPKLNLTALAKEAVHRVEEKLAGSRLLHGLYRYTIQPVIYGSYRALRFLYRLSVGRTKVGYV